MITVQTILLLSLGGSILALLYLALRRAFGRGIRKTVLYYLWIIVFLRFLLPIPTFISFPEMIPVPKPETNQAASNQIDATYPIQEAVQYENEMTNGSPAQTGAAIKAEDSRPTIHTTTPIGTENKQIPAAVSASFWQIFFAVWVVGVIGSFCWQIWRYERFRFLIRPHMKGAKAETVDMFHLLSPSRKLPDLAVCPVIKTPMLLGVFKPTILLPNEDFDRERLLHILSHELSHYHRKDLLYKWFVMLVSCLHWFNPLLHVIGRIVDHDCELACDELVIETMSMDERQKYGETLLQLSAERHYALATSMGEGKMHIKKRILSIVRHQKRGRKTIALALALAMLLLLTGCGALLGNPNSSSKPEVKIETDDIDFTLLSNLSTPSKTYYTISGTVKELHSVGSLENGFGSDGWYMEALTQQVVHDLMKTYDLSEDLAKQVLFAGGLDIYTCLNPTIQSVVDEVYSNPSNLDYRAENGEPMQSAITVVDNETGYVVALAGGMGENTASRGLNRATSAPRQPGSLIKPLSVYAPAIEMGELTPNSIQYDKPNSEGWPKNSYNSYKGAMSVMEAVRISSNCVAVNVMSDIVTPEKSFEFMKNVFHITSLVEFRAEGNRTVTDIAVAPLALGELTDGVTAYEMAAAYSTFARDGVYSSPILYTKVCDQDGHVLLENKTDSEVALKAKTAQDMTEMLQTVMFNGTGKYASFQGQDMAGKTGTTSPRRDLWFVGYTPYYTAAVWSGYDQGELIENETGNPSLNLWKQVMETIHAELPYKAFNSNT